MLPIREDNIMLRPLEYGDPDFDLLEKWLNDEEVQEYYEGRDTFHSREQILYKFGPRALGEHDVKPSMIEYRGEPIGYIQHYKLSLQEQVDYGVDHHKEVYGIDLFIGETSYWNKGLGTTALRLLVRYVFTQLKADIVCIDPQTWNLRAIRSYEKCGFTKVKVLEKRELHEGQYKDIQVMTITREHFQTDL